MSFERLIEPTWIIKDADMSASSIVSEPVAIKSQLGIFVQLIFTGTPTGDFYLETSLNYKPVIVDSVANSTWTPLQLNPLPIADGAADDIGIDLTISSAPWIRVKYVRTSGSGTLNAYISGK